MSDMQNDNEIKTGTGNASPEALGKAADRYGSSGSQGGMLRNAIGVLGILLLFVGPVSLIHANRVFVDDHVSGTLMEWFTYHRGLLNTVNLCFKFTLAGVCLIWMAWLRDWITPVVLILGLPVAYLICRNAVESLNYIRSFDELLQWVAGYNIYMQTGGFASVLGVFVVGLKITALKRAGKGDGK